MDKLMAIATVVEEELCKQLDSQFNARIVGLMGNEPFGEIKSEFESTITDLLKFASTQAPHNLNARLRGSITGASSESYANIIQANLRNKLEVIRKTSEDEKVAQSEMQKATEIYDTAANEHKKAVERANIAHEEHNIQVGKLTQIIKNANEGYVKAQEIYDDTIRTLHAPSEKHKDDKPSSKTK